MDLIKTYQCFADKTRLRILNLLVEGPLCVCHLTELLGVAQPKVSRHLKGLRDAGLVEAERCYNWTIYRLPETPSMILEANLKCLKEARGEEPVFQADLERRLRLVGKLTSDPNLELPEQIRLLARSCN